MANDDIRLALEESWRSIDVQRDQLSEIKNRTIGTLSVATLAIGLFGVSVHPGSSDLDGWTVTAIVALIALLACSVFVAFPRRWVLARDPSSRPCPSRGG